MLRPVSTKPFFLTYVKRKTDVRQKYWFSGHGHFANRPADTVSSLSSDRRLTVADNTRQKKKQIGSVSIMFVNENGSTIYV